MKSEYNCILIKRSYYILKNYTIKMDINHEPNEETNEVAGFIAKTFEILNVPLRLFRIKTSLELFTGDQRALNLSSRTSTSFSKLFSLNISVTTK